MKKVFSIITILFLFFVLSSCGNSDFYDILDDYSKKESIVVTEITEATFKSNKIATSKRVSSIEGEYFNSIIRFENIEGYVHYQDNKFYYSYDKSFKVLDNSFDSLFNPLGIDSLFTEGGFKIKDNIAQLTIKTPTTAKYENLLRNVCLDFNKDYEYNIIKPIDVKIKYSGNDIEYISFDLLNSFSNDFNYLTKTITFEEKVITKLDYSEDINTKLDSLVNKDYMIKTGATLDTYMIEMTYMYGDSIYIKSGDFDMLVDSGQYNDGESVNNILEQYCNDGILDVLIATHGDGDHVGGFGGGALDCIDNINLIIDYGYTSPDKYQSVKQDFIKKGANYYCAYDCVNNNEDARAVYQFSNDLSIEILDTKQYAKVNQVLDNEANENDYSVVLLLRFKNNTYLYTGDISGDDGIFIDSLLTYDIKDITVYKAAHHGAVSHKTNTVEFLNYINPEICIISAAIVDQYNPHNPAQDDIYQHPRFEFIERLLRLPKIGKSKSIYFNGTMGTIHLSDNGMSLPSVNGFGAKRGYYINGVKVTGEQNLKFTDTQFYKHA